MAFMPSLRVALRSEIEPIAGKLIEKSSSVEFYELIPKAVNSTIKRCHMIRVVVHAGFHKTGTTSIQRFFENNKDKLAAEMQFFGPKDIPDIKNAADAYTKRPFRHRLWMFKIRTRQFLSDLPETGTVLISCENLSGGMPGHRTWNGRLMTGYERTGPSLLTALENEIRRRFGNGLDLVFYFSLRERDPWLKSIYGHLLRSIQLTDDFPTFRSRFSPMLSPANEATVIAKRLSPLVLRTSRLEDLQDKPEGPAASLLDCLGVSVSLRATLAPASRRNVANSPPLQAAFLKLNCSKLGGAKLKSAKIGLTGTHQV